MALAVGKRVMVCGLYEKAFHTLPRVERVNAWTEAHYMRETTPESRAAHSDLTAPNDLGVRSTISRHWRAARTSKVILVSSV